MPENQDSLETKVLTLNCVRYINSIKNRLENAKITIKIIEVSKKELANNFILQSLKKKNITKLPALITPKTTIIGLDAIKIYYNAIINRPPVLNKPPLVLNKPPPVLNKQLNRPLPAYPPKVQKKNNYGIIGSESDSDELNGSSNRMMSRFNEESSKRNNTPLIPQTNKNTQHPNSQSVQSNQPNKTNQPNQPNQPNAKARKDNILIPDDDGNDFSGDELEQKFMDKLDTNIDAAADDEELLKSQIKLRDGD